MRRHAVALAPAECCGGLIGAISRERIDVRGLVPLRNVADDPARYLIEADTVLRLERHATATGRHVVGFYHSHPCGSAEPSDTDLDLASPGYVYVIVQSSSGAVRGWRLRDDRAGFDEQQLTLMAGAP
ncbi:hypothetical protein BH23GEM9_BH23GEM9_13100 [soil metagenome]